MKDRLLERLASVLEEEELDQEAIDEPRQELLLPPLDQ